MMCRGFFFSSRRRHTRLQGDWSSDVCSSDLFWISAAGHRAPPASRLEEIAGPLLQARADAQPLVAWEGALLQRQRSEEHTSELQSPCNLVCRLLLEKKKNATEMTIAARRVSS